MEESGIKTQKNKQLRSLAYLLTIGGTVGFAASFLLTIEKIELIRNPAFQPSCNISPLINCGSVMETSQAELFGFANSLLGVAGFSALAAIGIALLAGARFKRWLWLGLETGVSFGIAFVTWLQFQSIYVIEALCPYCMVVWAVMIPVFLYVTIHNLQAGHIKTPKQLTGFVSFLSRHRRDLLLFWYVAILVLILQRFWYYWQTLI